MKTEMIELRDLRVLRLPVPPKTSLGHRGALLYQWGVSVVLECRLFLMDSSFCGPSLAMSWDGSLGLNEACLDI